MKRTRKSKKCTTLAQKLFETGLREDRSDTDVFRTQLERHGSMTLIQLESFYCKLKLQKPKAKKQGLEVLESYMSECLLLNNAPILPDNKSYFKALSQMQKLSQTLALGLTSIVRDYPPWYDESVATKFHKLWLPSVTESVGLDTSSSNSCAKNMDVPSWFTVKERNLNQNKNLRMTSSPWLTSSSPATTGSEQLPSDDKESSKKPVKGTLMVRLYSKKNQTKKMDLMMAGNRFVWNEIARRSEGLWDKLTAAEFSKLFRKYSQMEYIKSTRMAIAECHSDCFDSAYQEFLKSSKTIKALSKNKKDKTGQGFQYPVRLHFKTKKKASGYIDIRPRDIKYYPESRTISLHPKFFGEDNHIAIKTDLKALGITSFNYSVKLCLRNGQYYLMVPHSLEREVPEPVSKVCSLDPGVRTFMAGYDPDGGTLEVSFDRNHLLSKKRKIEALQSDLESVLSKRARRVIKKRIRNLYSKIKNCVHDLHHKTSRLLVDNYEEVVLPEFMSSKMLKKGERNIGPETAYLMQTLSHYKFRELLKCKMEQRGRRLILCTEEFTSMTCGQCGRLNHGLGGDEIFVCPYCSLVAGRDINAARNIFIKNYH